MATMMDFRSRLAGMAMTDLDQLEKSILDEGLTHRVVSSRDVRWLPKLERINAIALAKANLRGTVVLEKCDSCQMPTTVERGCKVTCTNCKRPTRDCSDP